VGTREGATDYNVLYLALQKCIPGVGGHVATGVYHGRSDTLFTNSDGEVKKTGALLAVFCPDIPVGWKGLKKAHLTADLQTGKNVMGAGGFGACFYFTDTIALLTGPAFLQDGGLQPGGRSWMWTFQVDIDIPLGRNRRGPT
jgi:hypothetical protein